MFTNRAFSMLTFVAILVLTACAPQSAPTSTAASVPEKPVTLRLAVSDAEGRPSEQFVREFVEQVKTLSNADMTIEPVWDAGANTQEGFEKGVIQLVKNGEADLGLAASRAWDSQVFPTLQVLQTPFLITDDALAKAVATSDATTQILDSLSSGGVVGLTLWPEDLRHPFSVDPAKPLLSPQDFAGLTIRTTDTGVDEQLMRALGGTPIFEATDYQGAESGLLQGATLMGQPAATGNVVFFPKYQVLFANSTAFNALSEERRNILRKAATITQTKALAERPSEAEAGASWCADGGTIVLASEEQVAAFETAAKPVYDTIAQAPSNAGLIAAIRDLKAKTLPAPEAEACVSEVAKPSPEPNTVTQVWSDSLLPNGVWQAELSVDDIMAVGGVLRSSASESAGIHTFTFQNGNFTWQLKGENPGSCAGTYDLVGDVVRLTMKGGCAPEVDDLQWRLDEDGLHLHLVAIKNAPFAAIKANLEAKPYQKVADQ